MTQNKQNSFLRTWLLHNLIGWGIGGLITIPTYFTYISIAETIISFQFVFYRAISGRIPLTTIEDIITSIIIWFPFSLAVGVMQGLALRHYNIKIWKWACATTFAWVVSMILTIWLFDTLQKTNFISWNIGGVIAEIVLVGTFVGLAQAFVIHKSLSMSVLWVFSHSMGFLALGFFVTITWLIGYDIGKRLEHFFFSLGTIGFSIVGNRDLLLDIFVLLTVPVWAALAFGLPTGLIFSKYNTQPDLETF